MARERFARYLLLANIVGIVAIAAVAGLSTHPGPTTALASGAAPHAPPLGPGGQISGPPTELSAGCSLDILSWGQCFSDAVNYVVHQASNAVNSAASYMQTLVEGVVLALYQGALTVVVDIVVAVGQAIAQSMIVALGTFTAIASLLGIFALPFLTITTVALAGGVYIAFEVLKDTPVLGALE